MNFFRNVLKDMDRPALEMPENLLLNILKSPNVYDNALPCELLHGANSYKSCQYSGLMLIAKWFKSTWKLFLLAHALPVIFFQRKEFMENPRRVIKRVLIKFLRSQAFILSHAKMCQVLLCNTRNYCNQQMPLAPLAVVMFMFTGTIFFEAPGKIEETMLWVMPRCWEQAWNFANKLFYQSTKKKLPTIPGFQYILFGLSIASLCCVYNANKKSLKGKYLAIAQRMIADEPVGQKTYKKSEKLEKEKNPFLQD